MSVPATVEQVAVKAAANTWAFGSMKGTGVPRGGAGQLPGVMGKDAPDFSLKMVGGETYKLSESIGKEVVILDFWATWCGPCIQAMPDVIAAVKEFEGQGVRLIGRNPT